MGWWLAQVAEALSVMVSPDLVDGVIEFPDGAGQPVSGGAVADQRLQSGEGQPDGEEPVHHVGYGCGREHISSGIRWLQNQDAGFVANADAEDLQTKIEQPVESALQLRLVGQRSAQLGVAGVAAKRESSGDALEALAELAFDGDTTPQTCHELIVLERQMAGIPRHGVHPGEMRVPVRAGQRMPSFAAWCRA